MKRYTVLYHHIEIYILLRVGDSSYCMFLKLINVVYCVHFVVHAVVFVSSSIATSDYIISNEMRRVATQERFQDFCLGAEGFNLPTSKSVNQNPAVKHHNGAIQIHKFAEFSQLFHELANRENSIIRHPYPPSAGMLEKVKRN